MLAANLILTTASAQTIQINRENKTIAISTTDESTAMADIAAVTVGFEIYGAKAEDTYRQAGALSQKILAAVRRTPVDDKDIESAEQGLLKNTQIDEKASPEEKKEHQYLFRQSWEVAVNVKLAAEVIRSAIASGANKTGDIEWRLSDRKALQAKAAEAALVKARAVAEKMAEGLHVKLGPLIYASNQTPPSRIYFPAGGGTLNTETVEVSAAAGEPVPMPALEIRPQTIREEATVYAVFAIE
jgi:uncharacterized protein YggE